MFIGDFEEDFLVKKWIGVQPKLWKCYIDDICIVMSHYYFTIKTIQYFYILISKYKNGQRMKSICSMFYIILLVASRFEATLVLSFIFFSENLPIAFKRSKVEFTSPNFYFLIIYFLSFSFFLSFFLLPDMFFLLQIFLFPLVEFSLSAIFA